MSADTKVQAQGHWENILVALNLDASLLTRPNVKCPLCPESTDSFSFTDHEGHGKWLCRKCGRGDGFDLLQRLNSWDFKRAKAEVQRVLGAEPIKPPFKPVVDPAKALNAAYLGSKPVRKGDGAFCYLQARGLSVLPPNDLRFHPGLPVAGKRYPAMLAILRNVKGAAVSIHRTFLQGKEKAPLESPRMFMKGKASINGCAIRLWPAESAVGLAEGVETSLAAYELYGVPMWACADAIRLETVELPPSIKEVYIYADNDSHKTYTGQRAAFIAAERLSREGRKVSVSISPLPGSDFLNELLLRQGRAA